MEYPKKNKYGEIIFKDFPDFTPNLTPIEIFELGSFGGTYWRQIKSSITNKKYNLINFLSLSLIFGNYKNTNR